MESYSESQPEDPPAPPAPEMMDPLHPLNAEGDLEEYDEEAVNEEAVNKFIKEWPSIITDIKSRYDELEHMLPYVSSKSKKDAAILSIIANQASRLCTAMFFTPFSETASWPAVMADLDAWEQLCDASDGIFSVYGIWPDLYE